MIQRSRGAAGFTLGEMVITLAVIGILTAIAYPSYEQYLLRARRAAAKNLLMDIASRQGQFFANNKQYASVLTSLGYATNPIEVDANGQIVTAGSSGAKYRITVASPTTVTYTLSAIPINKQATDTHCGTFTVTETGVKGVSGSGTVANCW